METMAFIAGVVFGFVPMLAFHMQERISLERKLSMTRHQLSYYQREREYFERHGMYLGTTTQTFTGGNDVIQH